jgi:hypothetical protein
MGNSPSIIERTYKNLTNKRQAEKWFAIDPSEPEANQGKAGQFIRAKWKKFGSTDWSKERD